MNLDRKALLLCRGFGEADRGERQVPPRSCDSIIATDVPARLTGPVTPMPALPPPRITTSNLSIPIENIPMSRLIPGTPCGQAGSLARPEPVTRGVRALLLVNDLVVIVRMNAQFSNMKYALALKSIAARYDGRGHAPRLSNRLCNGIFNFRPFRL
jgi:hypothetical protein